jgi:hypothetical protein
MSKITFMITGLVIVIMIILLLPFHNFISQFKNDELQQWIACIYAVTALLSFCSFIGVIYTVSIQFNELKLSRKAQEKQTDYARLNALTILNEYYRTEYKRRELIIESLQGMEGQKNAINKSLDTLDLFHETITEIEKYHSTLCKSKT